MSDLPVSFARVLAAMSPWLVVGFFAEAFGGGDWLAMPVMALVGFPMYFCSTASIPITDSRQFTGPAPHSSPS